MEIPIELINFAWGKTINQDKWFEHIRDLLAHISIGCLCFIWWVGEDGGRGGLFNYIDILRY